jgi:O-antigen/teichoic acid export membrane protein
VTARGTRLLVRAIWWVFANTVSPRLGMVVIGLVFARTMGPGDFGVFAVAVIALLGIQSLEQLGVGRAMAAWRGDPYQVAPTVTLISVLSGAVICATAFAVAPRYAVAMGEPAASGPIRWLAVSVAISALATAPAAILQMRSPRAMSVMTKAIENWIAVGVAIGLSFEGHALTGLVVGRIAGSATAAVLSVLFAPRALRIGFDPKIARLMLSAGLPLAAFSLLLFGVGNADLICIGRLRPGPDLAIYLLALCLASWPIALCTQPVRDHAPATFAKFRRSPQVADSAFRSAMSLIAWLTVPICVLMISSAGNIVDVLYGPRWAPVAPVLAWLVPLAVLRVCGELSVSYLSARASLRAALAFQLAFLVATVLAVLAGLHWDGPVGAAVAQVILCVPALVVSYLPGQRRSASRLPTLIARLGIWLLVLAAIGWLAFSVRLGSDPRGRLVLAVASVISLGITVLLVRRNQGTLSALRQSSSGARWSLAPDVLASILATTVEPMRYPALTLIRPPLHLPERAPATLTAEPEAAGEDNLGNKVRSGALWSTLNTLILRIANFATTVLLARTVFGPQAFGVYAVSQVILALLLSANEMGVSLAIVRWDGDVRTFARTVYTLGVISSTLLYGVLYVAAPQLARLLGSPGATGMVRVLCLCVIIDGLVCVQLALLTRAFAQRRLMLVNSLNFIVSTGITLWLAFAGYGPISFAWGSVAGCLVSLVAASVAAPFFVLPGWNTDQARRLLRFGLPLAGASLLLLGVYNVDSMVVGATLGPVALGLYALAFNISSWPVRAISEAARRVSFAGFSRVADSAELLADVYSRAIGLVMAAAVPACVLLGTLAEPLIQFLYGQRWTSAAPVLTLLSALGLLRVIYEISYDCLAAAGKRSTLLGVQGWWLATLCPALIVGARLRGIVGVGAGHVIVAGLLVGPAFAWALSRCGIPVRMILGASVRPLIGGILMGVTCEFALYAMGRNLAGMMLAAAAGSAVYLPVVLPLRTLLHRTPQTPAELEEEPAA